MFTLVQGWRRF